MGMDGDMFGLIPVISSVVSGVSGYFKTKAETKKAAVVAKAKLEINKAENEHQVNMTDAEWEALSKKSEDGTWKDEYITIIITAPIVGVLSGAVWNAFTGNRKLLDGTLEGIAQLKALGLNWDTLTTAVVLAAIGLKMWRAR